AAVAAAGGEHERVDAELGHALLDNAGLKERRMARQPAVTAFCLRKYMFLPAKIHVSQRTSCRISPILPNPRLFAESCGAKIALGEGTFLP
ncbi:MAG: hypothetical protein CMH67_07000, partial [Nisaea sp.]